MELRGIVATVIAALVLTATVARAGIMFTAAPPVATVPGAAIIATGDLNRDGLLDVVVVGPNSKELQVLLATDAAPAKLAPGGTYRFGNSLRRAAVGDLDADGIPDVVCTDQAAPGVWILRGRGDGTLLDPYLVEVGRNPNAVAIAEVDASAGPDLLVADIRLGKVFVLLNDGAAPPMFRNATEVRMGEEPEELVAIDVNRDRRPDIVTLNLGGPRVKEVAVSRFRGIVDGVPEFEAPRKAIVDGKPWNLLAAELTGDGAPDLVLLNRRTSTEPGQVVVLANDGGGTFEPEAFPVPCPVFTGGVPCGLRALAAADIDRNNRTDLAIAIADPRPFGGSPNPYDLLQVFSGRGDGRFGPGAVFAIDKAPMAIAAGHVTDDCLPDLLVTARASTLRALVNNSNAALNLNGVRCAASGDCISGRCTDARCCATECAAGERCDVAGFEGICRPALPAIVPCEADTHCSGPPQRFCADGVCCSTPCTDGRCNDPGFEGVCVGELADGQPCEDARQCASGFCSSNLVCCGYCEGFCDAQGVCRPLQPLGELCDVDDECASGVCDVFDGICCNRRCETYCDPRGRRGPGGFRRSATAGADTRREQRFGLTACRADCDGDGAVGVAELIGLVAVGLGIDTLGCSVDRCVSIEQIVSAVNEAMLGCASQPGGG